MRLLSRNCAGYTVNVSRIAPLAQNISQAGFDLLDSEGKPYLLIQPVIQVSSSMRGNNWTCP